MIILGGMVLLAFMVVVANHFLVSQAELPPSKERIIQLIKGEVKAQVLRTSSSIRINKYEVPYIWLKHQYQMAKLFGQASVSADNKLQLANGDTISPHSREHGIQAGFQAMILREKILKEYNVDLEYL